MRAAWFVAVLTACSGAHKSAGTLPDAPGADTDAPPADAGIDAPPGACASATDTAPVTLVTADHAAEYTLAITANSESATSWGTAGNEAVVLSVAGSKRGFIGHLVLH